MFIFRIETSDRIVGYVRDFQTAVESLRISWSAYPSLTIETDVNTITVKRDGFAPIEYLALPVEVHAVPVHL